MADEIDQYLLRAEQAVSLETNVLTLSYRVEVIQIMFCVFCNILRREILTTDFYYLPAK